MQHSSRFHGTRPGILGAPRVLVVDDRAESRAATLRVLAQAGCEAMAAPDGRQAVELLGESDLGSVGLVLMDLVMPRMDGLEATRAIRRLPGWEGLPIIGWSSRTDDHARAAALAAGMDDLVRRHSDAERLGQLVQRWAGSS